MLMLNIMFFSAMSIRIYSMMTKNINAGYSGASLSVDVETLRGTVYDCNMHPLTNAETVEYIAVKPVQSAFDELKTLLGEEISESVIERLAAGRPVVVPSDGKAVSTNAVKPFTVPKRYGGTACHIIGYLGSEGKGVSGTEKAYDDLLASCERSVTARFRADAGGRVMAGAETEIIGNDAPKKGIVLTLDKDIQSAAESALDLFGVERGCAVVLDVETGAIRACVSRPAFDPDNIAASLNDENSPLINRAFMAYSVGSVFKSVIASAAIECGEADFEFDCDGDVEFSSVVFNCHKKDGHGVLDLENGIAYSCNTYFASLGQRVGAEKIVETAEKFGFGKSIELAPGIVTASGNLPKADELDSPAAIANISFGQGALTATPLQICAMTAAIANGGVYIAPYLVEGEADENGDFTAYRSYSEKTTVIERDTADILCGALKKVVEKGSGTRALSELVAVAGKTATAQTGKFGADGEIFNAWFSGWFPADEPKYAVTVLKEDGGEGAVSCAPIFKYIAEALTALNK